MIELSEQNAVEYLRSANRVSPAGEILVQSLSGGVANVVLKIFDTAAGTRIGSDIRSPAQKKLGRPDTRLTEGACFVLKQPLPKFKTEAEWLVDIDRVLVERDCMQLLETLLPAGSVPRVLWYDDANYILAISCAPTGAVIWKKALLAGQSSIDAATHAGMLMAIMHSSAHTDDAVRKRYSDKKLFEQQRIDPYFLATAEKRPEVAPQLKKLGRLMADGQLCLIHGDFSPKNIFLIPGESAGDEESASSGENQKSKIKNQKSPPTLSVSQLMLLDFEVAYFGHPAFDVATLINHLLLKGFYHREGWRPFMMMADTFWQTYRHTADPTLAKAAEAVSGSVLGALMLARIDGKSPAEYLVGNEPLRQQVRNAALALLQLPDGTIERALDAVSMHFDAADE